MKPTDEQISAWMDGALPPDEAEKVTAARQADKSVAERIASMAQVDALLREAVPLNDEVPPELLARLGLGGGGAAGNVMPFASRQAAGGPATRTGRAMPWWQGGWKVAAQFAAVALLGLTGAVWLMPSGEKQEAKYRTLSASAPSPTEEATAIVLFESTVDRDEADAIAATLGARIAGDQTPVGAWPLAVAPNEREEVLGKLRRRGDVIMAEAIGGR